MVPIARFCPKSKRKINLPLRIAKHKSKTVELCLHTSCGREKALSQSFGKILVSKMKEMLHVKCESKSKTRCSEEISRTYKGSFSP